MSGASFVLRYEAQEAGGYVPRERTIAGPFYHGGRARLNAGGLITPGRKTNGWGDEGRSSRHVYFSTDPNSAEQYARQAHGHLYEVEPTGECHLDYQGTDFKSTAPLRVIRRIPPAEWGSLPAGGMR